MDPTVLTGTKFISVACWILDSNILFVVSCNQFDYNINQREGRVYTELSLIGRNCYHESIDKIDPDKGIENRAQSKHFGQAAVG